MVMETRSSKKYGKDTVDKNQTGSSSDRFSDDSQTSLDVDNEYEKKLRKSPYRKVRADLDDLLENKTKNQLHKRSTCKRRIPSRSRSRSPSRSRSRSPSRSPSRNAAPKTTIPTKLPSLSDKRTKNKKFDEKTSSSSWFKTLLWILMILITSAGLTHLIQSNYSSSKLSYQDILKDYKSDLLGVSSDVIEAAIEKDLNRNVNQENNYPVVLMLYGNGTRIKELYLKLADVLVVQKNGVRAEDLSQTVLRIKQLRIAQKKLIENLGKYKLALLDGLQELASEDYVLLFNFVDDSYSHVLNSLIVLSLHDQIDNSKFNFTNIDQKDQMKIIEKHVRQKLRKNFSDIEVSKLEAFLNRIVSFVAFVS